MITINEYLQDPFQIEQRVIHLFKLISSLEKKVEIELQRVRLCEQHNFDIHQIFETIKMNSYSKYIDSKSLITYFSKLKLQFTQLEVDRILLHFSSECKQQISFTDLKNMITPHEDLPLFRLVTTEDDMKNGGPRGVFSFQIEQELRDYFDLELTYFRKVNRCKMELMRDFGLKMQEQFTLSQHKIVNKPIIKQWLLLNEVDNYDEISELVWRRMFNLDRSKYLPTNAYTKDITKFLLPDDYQTRVQIIQPDPITSEHFHVNAEVYYSQPKYMKEKAEKQYVKQDWRKPKQYRQASVTFYNNSNGIKPYQSDKFHQDYMKYQQSKIKMVFGS